MSVRKRDDRDGQYEVRWREGGRQRSRLFGKKGDAQAFELDVKRRRQLGPLAAGVIQSRLTLAEYVRDEWWPRYAVPNLKPSTRRRYLEVWGTHLLPRIGDYQLREITPALVEDLCSQFRAAKVGVQTQRKAVMLLQGILRRAVVRGLIPSNPVSVVDKPRQPATKRPEPLAPLIVETIRAGLSQRDATLVSVLAYGGLRPEEATNAHWDDLGERILHAHAGKTERDRVVDVLGAARAGLGGMETRAGASRWQGAHLPASGGQGVAAARLAELAEADLPARGQGCRSDRGHAPLPASWIVRLPAAVGGTVADLRGRAGRALGCHPRKALRRRDARTRRQAADTGRRGDPQRP